MSVVMDLVATTSSKGRLGVTETPYQTGREVVLRDLLRGYTLDPRAKCFSRQRVRD